MVAGVTTTGLVLLALVGLGGVVGVAFAVTFVRRDLETPGATPYVRLMLASAGMSFGYFVQLVASNRTVIFASEHIYAGFSLLVVAFWFEFTIEYTGSGAWLTRSRRAALYAYLGGYFLLLVTNPLTGLLRRNLHVVTFEGLSVVTGVRTPFMWLQLGVIYLLVGTGFVLLGRFFLATRNVYRKQTATILLGGILIAGGNSLYFAGVVPLSDFDPTSLMFVANGLVIGVALVRYDFLEVVPLAADMLIEEMDDPVIVVDAEDTVVDVNAAALALFAERPVGEQLTAVAPDLAAAIASGDQFTSRTRAGTTTFDPRTTAITDQHDIERGTLVVMRDVTGQVRRQAELERQNERLEEFASVVSHDLRNPLSVAHAYAHTALSENDTSYVEQTIESLDRMDELIDDLLTLAREGRTVDSVAQLSVAEFARRAWDQVATDDATLVVESDLTVTADDRRLQQLFENLFRNAVEHAGPDVTVTVGATADGGFYVADDGPGIPAESREQVFEHGYSSSDGGTGFGLAIVRTIADAHGWSVEVSEAADGGARFVVTDTASDIRTPHTPGPTQVP